MANRKTPPLTIRGRSRSAHVANIIVVFDNGTAPSTRLLRSECNDAGSFRVAAVCQSVLIQDMYPEAAAIHVFVIFI